jgi:hypothetical protein
MLGSLSRNVEVGRLALTVLSTAADAASTNPQALRRFVDEELQIGLFWQPLLQAASMAISGAASQSEARAVVRVVPLAVRLAIAGRALECAELAMTQSPHAPMMDAEHDEPLARGLLALLEAAASLLESDRPAAVAAQGLVLKHAHAMLDESVAALGASTTARLAARFLSAARVQLRAVAQRVFEFGRLLLCDPVWLSDPGLWSFPSAAACLLSHLS